MDIVFRGDSSFEINGERTVAINPRRGSRADVMLHTTRQKKPAGVVNGPGEYDIAGVLIVTLEKGPRESPTLAHSIIIDDLAVVHLGDITHELSDRDVAAIGRVDVLIVNADEARKAQDAIADLEPRVVIPFGAAAPEVCASLGVKSPEAQPRFTWSRNRVPPRAVVLKPVSTRARAA